VQSIKRFFHVKEYCDEKAFKADVHKLESYAFFGYESTKKQRARDGKCKIRTWTNLKKLMDKWFIRTWTNLKKLMDKWFLVGTYNQKPHSRVSSLNRGSLRGNECILGFLNVKLRVRLCRIK